MRCDAAALHLLRYTVSIDKIISLGKSNILGISSSLIHAGNPALPVRAYFSLIRMYESSISKRSDKYIPPYHSFLPYLFSNQAQIVPLLPEKAVQRPQPFFAALPMARRPYFFHISPDPVFDPRQPAIRFRFVLRNPDKVKYRSCTTLFVPRIARDLLIALISFGNHCIRHFATGRYKSSSRFFTQYPLHNHELCVNQGFWLFCICSQPSTTAALLVSDVPT